MFFLSIPYPRIGKRNEGTKSSPTCLLSKQTVSYIDVNGWATKTFYPWPIDRDFTNQIPHSQLTADESRPDSNPGLPSQLDVLPTTSTNYASHPGYDLFVLNLIFILSVA